jgi:hypothetical protein
MSLIKQWQDIAYIERSEEDYNNFWGEYLPKEQAVYDNILSNKTSTLKGTLTQLGQQFDMDPVTFTGFLDGINTSLTSSLELEDLTEESELTLSIDFEKLYYNMLDAKADWLYDLPAWDNILSVEKRKEIKKEYNKTKIVVNENKIGRNDPCLCGSGKKYKKCCIDK